MKVLDRVTQKVLSAENEFVLAIWAGDPGRYSPVPEATETAVQKPLDKMTLSELKAYAAEHGIALADAGKKDEILAVILAAREEGAEDSDGR